MLLFRKGSLRAGAKRRFEHCVSVRPSVRLFVSCLTPPAYRVLFPVLLPVTTSKWKGYSYAFPLRNKLSAEDRSLDKRNHHCLVPNNLFFWPLSLSWHRPTKLSPLEFWPPANVQVWMGLPPNWEMTEDNCRIGHPKGCPLLKVLPMKQLPCCLTDLSTYIQTNYIRHVRAQIGEDFSAMC